MSTRPPATAGETTAEGVRAMLGLADRGRVLDLLGMILRGDAPAALAELQAQYADGADPFAVLRDLAETTHWISVLKITPGAADDPTVAADERERGARLAAEVPMRVLTRLWQMLLKALEEMGFDKERQASPVAGLSGGWKMKLALARAILFKADILLLDEPTNHLDVVNVAWLEGYLTSLTTCTSSMYSFVQSASINVLTFSTSHRVARLAVPEQHHHRCPSPQPLQAQALPW